MVEIVDSKLPEDLLAGQDICVKARVHAGKLTTDDLAAELYLGRLNADGKIVDAISAPMGVWRFSRRSRR